MFSEPLRLTIVQLEKKLDDRATSDLNAGHNDASSAVGTNTNLSRREEKAPAKEDNESSVGAGTCFRPSPLPKPPY
jgi:hypothetical protein